MRLFYLISAILVATIILIIALPQVGATCTWYLIKTTANAVFVLLQMAALGAVMGGLLVLFWKAPKKSELDEDVEESEIKSE